VVTKNGKSNPMNVAEISRSATIALVRREERNTGSRMVAYDRVSQMIGMSSEWVRAFAAGRLKEPGLTVGFNLMMIYRNVCERVEQAAEQERIIREQIDAALASIGVMVEGAAAKAGGSREDQERT
jgi:hypothetical protein